MENKFEGSDCKLVMIKRVKRLRVKKKEKTKKKISFQKLTKKKSNKIVIKKNIKSSLLHSCKKKLIKFCFLVSNLLKFYPNIILTPGILRIIIV